MMVSSQEMTSYERYMAAFKHQQPDRVPIDLEGAPYKYPGLPRRPKQLEGMEIIRKLGGDPILDIWAPPESCHPYVKVTKGTCGRSEDGYPLLFAEYNTPAGTLRQVVRETPDWRSPKGHKLSELRNLDDGFREDWDVHLLDDWNAPRYVEPAIKSMEDIEKLKYVLNLPSRDSLAEWREEASTIKKWGAKHQVLVRGRRAFAGAAGMWLWHWPDYLVALAENPDMIEAFLGVVEDWNTRRAELLLDVGIDVLMFFGYYDTPDVYSPKNFDRFCRPFLEKLCKMSHEADCLLCLQRSMGNTRQVDVLKEMAIDILYDVEPGISGDDLGILKVELGEKYTLWGGIDSTTVMNRGSIGDIENAVAEAMALLSPGNGFVIRPIPWMEDDLPGAKEEIETVVEACKKYGTTPP